MMTVPMLKRPAVMAGLICAATALTAQTDSLRLTVADLKQDVLLLSQQVKTLRLEIEEMRRENSRLRTQVTASSNSQSQYQQTLAAVDARIAALRQEFQSADAEQQKVIIAEVGKQIDRLAAETQKQIDVIAAAVGQTPQIATPVTFSDDYPKTGITYTVRSGDTLSNIARTHGSTIKYIQNANKIVDPARDLQVGQTIFIPIKK